MFDKISGSPQYMAPEAGLLELEPGIVLGIGYKLYAFFLMFKLSIYIAYIYIHRYTRTRFFLPIWVKR